jgi:hypothetical protein
MRASSYIRRATSPGYIVCLYIREGELPNNERRDREVDSKKMHSAPEPRLVVMPLAR